MPVVSYLQTYTLGSIIRSAFSIHFHNLITLFAVNIVPLIPVFALKAIMAPTATSLTEFVFTILQVLVSMFVSYPAAVAVSEYCLGIKPSFGRSYARAFAAPGRLVKTILLSSAIVTAGYIALIVPGLVFGLWYLFVGPVVVLEGLGGVAALRRSRELGRGFYLRNLGVAMVVLLIAFVAQIALGLALGLILFIPMVPLGLLESLLLEIIIAVAAAAVFPIYIVASVLLYYDMRVRKEGYGAAQLAEDIRI